ncbi:MAG: transmembrane sensor, partial [Patiriisocius sp.]
MKEKEKLIQKWLDHDLTEAELKSFKTMDDFAAFEKIDQAAQHFKAPVFDSHANYTGILQLQQKKPSTSSPLFRYTLAIAAVGLVLFGLFNFLGKDSTASYYAEIGSQKNISLPDTSKVTLNAVSTLSYNDEKWDRNIYLEGEAYFKVTKGETFSVHTSQGKVQ